MKKNILIDSHVKISGRNYWYARFWQKLLLFLQGVYLKLEMELVPVKFSSQFNLSQFAKLFIQSAALI